MGCGRASCGLPAQAGLKANRSGGPQGARAAGLPEFDLYSGHHRGIRVAHVLILIGVQPLGAQHRLTRPNNYYLF